LNEPTPQLLEANYRNLDRVIGWVATADAKATTILAVNGVLLGLVASRLSDVIVVHVVNTAYVPYARGGYFLAACLFVVSLYRAVIVFYPQVHPPAPSVFFFESIAEMKIQDFQARIKELTPARIEDELILQTHTVATIAKEKLKNVRGAILDLLSGLLFLIAHYIFWTFATPR
jgi:pycsar effector protein